MSDPKPPDYTPEHLERANACRALLTRDSFGLVADDDVQALANQFAASDAIARRRTLEEAAEVCEGAYRDCFEPLAKACAHAIRALLRAPPDEKAECPRPHRLLVAGERCPTCGQPSGEGK